MPVSIPMQWTLTAPIPLPSAPLPSISLPTAWLPSGWLPELLLALPAHAEPAALAALGPLTGLAALGAFHGLNPAMGWLFAVALGLQRGSAWAVSRALVFVTAGHAVSVLLVVALLLLLGALLPMYWVRVAAGAALLLFGGYKLLRWYRHPRWVGMAVNDRDLVAWSFLMATAHGAGLMLAPIILNLDEEGGGAAAPDLAHHAGYLDLSDTAAAWGLGLGVHTLAMLLVMLAVALVVYWKVGLAFLRTRWLNLDLLWAGALFISGGVTLTLALL